MSAKLPAQPQGIPSRLVAKVLIFNSFAGVRAENGAMGGPRAIES